MEIVRLFVAFAACILVLWWMLNADTRKFRKFEAEVRGRHSISMQDFESHYFRCEQVPIDVAIRVRQILARFVAVDAEKILPDDDFQLIIRGNDVELITALELEFAVTIPNLEAMKMRPTVRSVSMALASIMQGSSKK